MGSEPLDTRPSSPPEMVGKYELLAPLEAGGMGAVYRARSPEGKLVALKVLKKDSPDERALARFEREKRLQADLGEAAGFVPLLDADVSGEKPFLVMPLLTGGTLRRKLERGPLSFDETAALGLTLARALGRAHERGIVHRDLKPENVLFADDGRALIADLGLAKRFSSPDDAETESPDLSKSGTMQGTVRYMAPEQAENAKLAGPPADVFSLGAILYECLGGRPAFPGDSVVEVLRAIIRGAPAAPLESLRADVPADLAAIVKRALDRDPKARYANGAEMALALEGKVVARRRSLARQLLQSLVGAALALALVVGATAIHARLEKRRALAFLDEGDVLAHTGKDELARKSLDAAVELDPTLARAWHLRGMVCARTGETDQALSDLSKALELDPSDTAAWKARGSLRTILRPVEAMKDLSRAIALAPRDAEAWRLRALARWRSGDLDGALDDVEKAIEIDPQLPAAFVTRGDLRSLRRNRDGACKDYVRYLELAPDGRDAAHARSELMRLRQPHDESEEDENEEHRVRRPKSDQ